MTSRRILRFGAFEIDTCAGELRKSGLRVHLQGQPLQILLFLLDSPGEVVSREVLREKLWSADTFVDFDHSLNTAVKKLRQALGDEPDNPRFVETLPRRGYRFIAPVTIGLSNGLPHFEAEKAVNGTFEAPTVHPSWARKKLAIAACLCITGALLASVAAFLHPRTLLQTETHPVQITTNAAEIPISGSAISSDGRYLAYSDPTGLYLRVIATGETHSVALPGGVELRPDSWFSEATNFLATQITTSMPSQAPSIWTVPLVGSPRKLIDHGFAAAVSSDGSRIGFLRGMFNVNRLAGSEIWVANADGFGPHQLTAADKGEWLGSVTWSPDSHSIAYIRSRRPGSGFEVKTSIQVQRLAGGPPTTLLADPRLGNVLLWTTDGRILYSLANSTKWGNAGMTWASSASTIWAMPVRSSTAQANGPAVQIAQASGDVSRFSSAAATGTLAFVNEVKQTDVYISELDPSAPSAKPPRRLTLSDANEVPLAWTADSRAVIFISDRNGSINIFRQATGQSTADLIVGGRVNSLTPRLSPDGSSLVYLETPETLPRAGAQDQDEVRRAGPVRLMRVSLSDSAPPQHVLTALNIANVGCGTVGGCIFSTAAGGEVVFFAIDPATGTTRKLFTLNEEPTRCCQWSLSPDGLTLAVAGSVRNGRIRLISIPAMNTREIVISGWSRFASSQQPVTGGMDWAADGKGLFLSAYIQPSGLSLVYVDLKGAARVLLKGGNARWAIPSPDGRYIALHTFSVVQNVWFAGLTSLPGN